ncbi:MAG: hypothetical protein AAGA58_00225 [Verrucomicrobiota bacterium]
MVTHAKVSRGKIILDADEATRIWSDGAFLELGETFPDPIEEMLATPTHTHDISPFLADLNSRMDSEWTDARFATGLNESALVDVQSLTSKASSQIEPLYRDYIRVRFPNATIRIKDSTSPILVVIDGAIRASVMPKQ